MKHINKFFLILVLLFTSVFKPINASAKIVEGQALNSYLDKITKENFQKYKLPSLCMIVVKDGKIIYKNALGYADVKNKIKADVNSSVYRIGSTSKLFTETAIMQLYEQGKIDLKEDANKYLGDIKIQNKFAKKVTVENLLTHTSGIDEATLPYTAAKTKADIISLSEYLKKHQPVVTNEPGKVCLYSNIGLDLLGHIIENVSGMKYEDYIQKNIFNILGMQSSRVSLPLNNMTKNYDSLTKTGYVYYNDSPAGGINSTPLDISKFMMAHLQNGVYKNNKILNENTAKLMHEHHFSNDKNLCGIGYGFWEKNINGKRIISHEGALSVGYFDDMLLDAEENLGVYIVSNNLTSAAPAITDIENAFFNKYYSSSKLEKYSESSISSKEASKYVGTYRLYQDNAKGNILKFINLLGSIDENEDVQIEYNKSKNSLIYHGTSHMKKKEDTKLIKVSNNLFRRADNNELVAFREENNKIKYIFLNNRPFDNFERVNFKDNYKLSLAILIVAMLFFMFQIVKNVFIGFKKLIKGKGIFKNSEISVIRIFKVLVFAISLLNIDALFEILYWMMSFDMYYSVPWYIKAAPIIFIISTILVIGSSVAFILVIKREKTKLSYKILNSISILVMYAFVFFIFNWNLIGFRY